MEVKFNEAKWELRKTEEGGRTERAFWLMLKPHNTTKVQEFVSLMKDKTYTATIKEYRPKRSLDANAYLWTLCGKLAEVLGLTKEYIYRDAIRDAGQCDVIVIDKDAAETFMRRWEGHGIGWFCDKVNRLGVDMKNSETLFVYSGSSTYNTKEMARLIDYAVERCKEQDIETLTPRELSLLKSEWGV